MTFNGKYQYIEKEQYEKFIAKGNIILKDLLLVNAEFPKVFLSRRDLLRLLRLS